MKTAKKIFAILFIAIMIATMFIGCKKEEDSEPVNATEPISVSDEEMEEAVNELTEDISVEETKTDTDGNAVIVGQDDKGNTVEIKKNNDGTVTKTTVDKNTGKKTEQTTVVTTTKNTVTTTNKSVPSTTEKSVTQTNKPKSVNNTTTTTGHTHDYKPVYKTERIKVKDAYDEPVYTEQQAFYCEGCGIECVTESAKYYTGDNYSMFHMKHVVPSRNDGIIPLCPKADEKPSTVPGDYFGKPNWIKIQTGTIHHDAVYEDRKAIDYYKCSCGATK